MLFAVAARVPAEKATLRGMVFDGSLSSSSVGGGQEEGEGRLLSSSQRGCRASAGHDLAMLGACSP